MIAFSPADLCRRVELAEATRFNEAALYALDGAEDPSCRVHLAARVEMHRARVLDSRTKLDAIEGEG